MEGVAVELPDVLAVIRAAILFMVTAYPAFVLLGTAPSLGVLIAMVCWISLLKSFFSGALPSLMAKTFPLTTRVSGMSLSYNISVPIFGGFAPFFAIDRAHRHWRRAIT